MQREGVHQAVKDDITGVSIILDNYSISTAWIKFFPLAYKINVLDDESMTLKQCYAFQLVNIVYLNF